MTRDAAPRSLLILFACSGALGLGYQVLWSKILLQFVGVSAWSYAIVLAAFMAGLALGARFVGRLADLAASPLALFGWLELGVGLCAIAYPWASSALGELYLGAAASGLVSGGLAGLLVKALLAGLLLLPPTALMGATYPAMVRHATPRLALAGQRASQLYAINALGAVVGAAGMAFLLIPGLGLRASLMTLALGNATVGLAALALARHEGQARSERAPAPPGASMAAPSSASATSQRRGRWLLALLFAAGFVSFACEIAWTRFFAVVLGSSTHSFAIIVAVFIAGISLGAGLLSRFDSRIQDPLRLLGHLQLGAAALLLAPLPLMPYLPWLFGRIIQALPPTESAFWQLHGIKALACAAVMLPPALLMGTSIPLAVKAVVTGMEGLAADTGRVHAANTAGNVAGALAAGLALLPWLGVETLLRASGVALAAIGAGAIALAAGGLTAAAARRAMAAVLVLVIAAAALPRWNAAWFSLVPFRRDPMPAFDAARATVASRRVLLSKDDPASQLLVIEQDGPEGPARSLLVSGKPDASSAGDMPTQTLLGHLPMLAHPNPRKALVVGLASGVTAGAILRHDLDQLTVVDIARAMPEASRLFDRFSGAPLDDPRTRLVIDDARAFLATTTERFDVIVSEPSNPWVAGVGNLFAREHHARARRALAPGGVYLQWVQAYELSDSTLLAIIATFRSEFPHVAGFAVNAQDMLLIGSVQPLGLDPDLMLSRASAPVREQLAAIGIDSPAALALLATWSEPTVEWLAAASTLRCTDDNLLLEHETPRDLFLGATPGGVTVLDERLVASPVSPWAQSMRAGADPAAIVRLMASHRVGSGALYGAMLAALAAGHGGIAALEPALLAGVPDPSRFHPPGDEQLRGTLEALVAARDWEQLRRFAARERPLLAQRALIDREAGLAWAASIEAQERAGGGAAAGILAPLRADILAACGETGAARAALRASLPLTAPEPLALAACRLDPGPACDAFLKTALAQGPSPQLERMQALRASR